MKGKSGLPVEDVSSWIKHYRESEKLKRPVEFQLETQNFNPEKQVHHAIVTHERGNRFSFVLINLNINHEEIDESTAKRLLSIKAAKYKELIGCESVCVNRIVNTKTN